MGRKFAGRVPTALVALGSATAAFLFPSAYTQLLVIAAAALLGWALFRQEGSPSDGTFSSPVSPAVGVLALGLLLFLMGLSLLAPLVHNGWLDFATGVYRSGSLVFGGGHVVLPLLQQVVVPEWMDNQQFLGGYGLAQAVPGPLFTFASYLGATAFPGGMGIAGAVLGTAAMFLPAFLIVLASLPFWTMVRGWRWFRGALTGINAAVVGILLAALYNPIGVSALLTPLDGVFALIGFGLLMVWKMPVWVVVLAVGIGGAASRLV
jgi:chromate transporter